MRYVSTRGAAPVLEFADVLLAGMARDGGLYVPEAWPVLEPAQLEALRELPYAEAAVEVMWPYVEGSISRDELRAVSIESYSRFDDPAVVPLRELGGDLWLAELFHGPTLAFKDLALQVVGRLFDRVLSERGERATIVGATSGDTGSAAIEACRDRASIEVFILHPAGRVSEVQRRQMTTVDSPNVHNIAIEGTFDDCQDLVKALFADDELRQRLRLSAVNSINWARVMAQVVYYVTCSLAAGSEGAPASFSVPTGNFGNVFAGYVAKRMGAPVGRLMIASNVNDILTRTFASGEMELREVVPTLSPSMDIQISSNLERLLFELYGRRGDAVAELMQEFRSEGRVRIDPDRLRATGETFLAGSLDDDATVEVIRQVHSEHGVLIDPHTAVGVGVARAHPEVRPVVCMATAHPAKFPDAVERATGTRPELPAHLADLFEREERLVQLPNDLDAVRSHISASLLA